MGKVTNLLSKHQRKVLLEQTWSDFIKNESNPSQSRRRILDNAGEAIRDLTLIARKLPNDDFHNVFTEKSIISLLKSLLYGGERLKDNDLSSDAELASLIASLSIRVCRDEYSSLNKYMPNSAQPVIDYFDRTIAICEETGYKTQLERIEKEFIKKNNEYICRVEEIQNKDRNRFFDYAKQELDIDLALFHISIETRYHDDNHRDIIIFIEQYEGADLIGTITLSMDFNKNTCDFLYEPASNAALVDGAIVYNVDDNVNIDLTVKPYGKYHLLLRKQKSKK